MGFQEKTPVIIIGAGPAGLTAGYELLKLGLKSIVLEADNQVGGISRTVNLDGNRFDIGGHRFFSKIDYVNQIWDDLLGEDLLTCQRLSRIHYKGKFFDYPIKPVKALLDLGGIEAMRVLFGYAKVKMLPSNHELATFEDWVVNRFGYRLYEIFFKTYTEKVWGIPCHEISADWAAQRIKDLSLKEAILSACWPKQSSNSKVITTLIDSFKYPRLGPGMMWEACVDSLQKAHCPVLLNKTVKEISHQDNAVKYVLAQDSEGNESQHFSTQFISSMPLKQLLFSLSPVPPKEVMDAANKLQYRDFLSVVLSIDRQDIFPDNWIYIHTPEVKLGRIQNYKNWSEDMVKDPGRTTLGLEYFLWESDEEWTWPDQQLINLGISECVQIGLISEEEVVEGTVVRMKKAYPIYDRNYHSYLKVIKDYLQTFKNFQTIGRNGLHRYNNQDHSMMTGVYAARNIISNQYDVWNVNVEKEYHESMESHRGSTGDRMVPRRLGTNSTRSR